jgi:hypothetical protein
MPWTLDASGAAAGVGGSISGRRARRPTTGANLTGGDQQRAPLVSQVKTHTERKTGVVNPGFLMHRDHQFVWTLPAALKSLAGLYPESCRFLICVS